MFIYPKFKVIYIRVPATGSSTFMHHMNQLANGGIIHVEDTLRRLRTTDRKKHDKIMAKTNIKNTTHLIATQARELIDPSMWDEYEKIAFVSDPVAWTNSIYRKSGIMEAIGEDNSGTYTDYLKKLKKSPYFWFTHGSEVLVDTIYRREDLTDVLTNRFGFRGTSLTKHMVSIKPKVTPTEEDLQILKEKFAREFTHYMEV